MKLIGFEEFCRMPSGTIFAPWEPCIMKETLQDGKIVKEEDN